MSEVGVQFPTGRTYKFLATRETVRSPRAPLTGAGAALRRVIW